MIVKIFPRLKKTINPQFQGTPQTSTTRNLKKNTTPRDIIVKLLESNVTDKNIKRK
jgi:hypothetical protein